MLQAPSDTIISWTVPERASYRPHLLALIYEEFKNEYGEKFNLETPAAVFITSH
jgi:hypothetical protein